MMARTRPTEINGTEKAMMTLKSTPTITIFPRQHILSLVSSHSLLKPLPLLRNNLANLSYLFGGLVLSQVQLFILVTMLGAVDFWVVKNVSGRLLVGLRWWSDFDDQGK